MILILSQEQDMSTSNVIEWLLYYGKMFNRINEEDSLDFDLSLSNANDETVIRRGEEIIKLNEFKSYWYRRGTFLLNERYLKGDNNTIRAINTNYKEAYDDIKRYLHEYLKRLSFKINSYSDNDLNKLTELTVAKELGIKIPDTIITTKRSIVKSFSDKHGSIITKSIKGTLLLKVENTTFYWHTLLVTSSDIEIFPENFNPVKFQQYIEKAFELRIFYLNGKFYASAIFSQNDEKTKVDFRNYNVSNPNRVVPFNLPEVESFKLTKLMNSLNLVSGSLDIIVTPEGEYVFIEVNPIGQFTQVSYPCNYHLEQKLALTL